MFSFNEDYMIADLLLDCDNAVLSAVTWGREVDLVHFFITVSSDTAPIHLSFDCFDSADVLVQYIGHWARVVVTHTNGRVVADDLCI